MNRQEPGYHPRPASRRRAPPPVGHHPGPGSRRGPGRSAVDRSDRRMGRRLPPAGPRRAQRPPAGPRLLRRPGRGDHPSHARAWMPTPWPARSAPGWPTGSLRVQRPTVAVDGKTLRGARGAGGDGRPVHLLAAMDHASRAVLAQRQVGGAPEEVPAFAPLLAPLDLTGVVVTADALQTHPEAAEFLVGVKQAHYLLVVKANQPTLLDRCARLPWHRVPGRRPHPRPRPRPRRAAQPQGRQRPPLRVPARRPGPHRRRPHRHGGLAEPGRRRAQPGRAAQRRRATPPRPRPLPTPGHPGNQPRMNPTSRHNDGPWVAATCARGSCMRHRQALRSRGWSRVRIALPSIWPGLGQDLDVPVGSVHADPLPIPDHPGGIYHTDDGRQAVLPCDHCAVSHQSSDLRH
jgi:hypothetical protein